MSTLDLGKLFFHEELKAVGKTRPYSRWISWLQDLFFLSLAFHEKKWADLAYRLFSGGMCSCFLFWFQFLCTTYSLAEVSFHSIQAFRSHIPTDT